MTTPYHAMREGVHHSSVFGTRGGGAPLTGKALERALGRRPGALLWGPGEAGDARRTEIGKVPSGDFSSGSDGGDPRRGGGSPGAPTTAAPPAAAVEWKGRNARRNRTEAGRLFPARVNRKGVTVPSGLRTCRSFSPHQNRPNAPALPITAGRVRSPQGGVPVLANLNSCRDRACEECAKVWELKEARRVAGVTSALTARGWSNWMLTPTIRHALGDDFRALRDAMDGAWDAVFSGRWWANVRALCGSIKFVRSFESTFGQHGHHPHYHALMFIEREPESVTVYGSTGESAEVPFGEWFREAFAERFAAAVARRLPRRNVPFGAYSVRFEKNQDANKAQAASRYLFKQALEVVGATNKTEGKNPSMPFGVIDRIRVLRESEAEESVERQRLEWAVRNWREGSKSTTRVSWSKGLRDMGEDAPEEPKPEPEIAAFIPHGYSARLLGRLGFALLFLDALATSQGAKTLRSIYGSAWEGERQAAALAAWDREQRRWTKDGCGGWIERPPDEWNTDEESRHAVQFSDGR